MGSENEKLLVELRSENEELRKQIDMHRHQAQIEASLERVRAKSMAMQNSDELNDVLGVFFRQFDILGIKPVTAFLSLFDLEKNILTYRSTSKADNRMQTQQVVDLNSLDVWRDLSKKWKNNQQDSVEVIFYSPEILEELFSLLDEAFSAMPEKERITASDFPDGGYAVHGYCKFGYIGYNHHHPPTDREKEILIKFAQEFGWLYQRFLDIQNLEEQAGRAQIEASLERVRVKGLAMQSTRDIESATVAVFHELSRLGIDMERCGIVLLDEESTIAEVWSTTPSGKKNEVIDIVTGSLDFKIHPMLMNTLHDWIDKKDFTSYTLKGDELWKYYDNLEKQPEYPFPKIKEYPDQQVLQIFYFNEGGIFIYTLSEMNEDEKRILKRFTKVFEQTYTRFLDLKKAEKQARESQVEAALERVRSQAMAMQTSENLHETIIEFFNQLKMLGIVPVRCGVAQMFSDPPSWEATATNASNQGMTLQLSGLVSDLDHPVLQGIYDHWVGQEDFFPVLKGKELKEYYDILRVDFSIPKFSEGEVHHGHYFNFKEGNVYAWTYTPLNDAEKIVFKRFSSVLSLTYRRYLDLKESEAQAREAKIEAALERCRSRSMGMQKSEDLQSVFRTLHGEFQHLNVDFDVAVIQQIPDDTRDLHLWVSTADGLYEDIVHWTFKDLPIFHQIYKARTGDKVLEYTLDEVETKEFFEEFFKLDGVPAEQKTVSKGVKVIDFAGFYQKHTGIFLMRYTEGSYSVREKDIISRFSKVFEQTYTRFLDIQRAEKLAIETARQSSLDRIRAEIASMRSSEDLQQITPLIWDELKTLEIPFIRCGVFIMDEECSLSHTYLSTSKGEPIAALHLPLEGIPLVENIRSAWSKNDVYTEHWSKKGFRTWTQNLIDKGFIDSKKKYEAGSAPESLDLHFLPFKHGMLYIGNTEPLSKKRLNLGQSMADAFSVAYDRFEDFNKLEQAKQKIEDAFRELEAAQGQLVQQEKLASLGQLTAGIAHEIKNPLNFVNNFSEVSIEMLDEVREEVLGQRSDLKSETEGPSLEGGRREGVKDSTGIPDSDLILEILDDIEVNLRKIHEHGARADGIVKSMLQHSRGGSGEMKPTLVNSLIKEYTNLAFHGMRAAKNPINVDIELELDENAGEVNLVTEDFSRVIVNLCNNAFDAMKEKLAADGEPATGYKPKLTVRTKKTTKGVRIDIEDNGPGIPEEIKDKVLQPFFTTKKGTAGTGLGLSITNDIIKAHGGELQIESEKNSYTRFCIRLQG
jgi:signal transduction histidine kinase